MNDDDAAVPSQPVPPASPPAAGRVRVVAPRSQARSIRASTSVSQEVAEQSAVGEVMVRSLIRSQLRLALVVSAGFMAALLICWMAVRWVPAFADWRILGIPAPWLMLGVGVYPIIGASAWLYVRAATRNENQYRDLVEGK
ncbi:hypothetical protein [Arthrobacter livingstonensis]|uniref:hypothetical protein n=1 Tax=Arthrobacter livingstonensis TaxID=670078 RepID=UPI001FE271FE|nr:hypothetical protein [Arthrobacter livingstonensis]